MEWNITRCYKMSYDKLVMIDDNGNQITGKCAASLSGGDLLGMYSATQDKVGSNIDTYAWDDIIVEKVDSMGDNCVGLAQQNTDSGGAVALFGRGYFILPAGSAAVSGGQAVMAAGYGNMVIPWIYSSGAPIGRALSDATALTGFAIVRLNV